MNLNIYAPPTGFSGKIVTKSGKNSEMARKWPISPISLFNEAFFRVKLYLIRSRIENGIFLANLQVCTTFRYRVINEKRAEKSVDEISPTMDPEKSIFDDESEFKQIWWRCYRHSVECAGQVSSAFEP